MISLSQIFILCPLNLDSAVCQLYLNETGRKKKKAIDLISKALAIIVLAIFSQIDSPQVTSSVRAFAQTIRGVWECSMRVMQIRLVT